MTTLVSEVTESHIVDMERGAVASAAE